MSWTMRRTRWNGWAKTRWDSTKRTKITLKGRLSGLQNYMDDNLKYFEETQKTGAQAEPLATGIGGGAAAGRFAAAEVRGGGAAAAGALHPRLAAQVRQELDGAGPVPLRRRGQAVYEPRDAPRRVPVPRAGGQPAPSEGAHGQGAGGRESAGGLPLLHELRRPFLRADGAAGGPCQSAPRHHAGRHRHVPEDTRHGGQGDGLRRGLPRGGTAETVCRPLRHLPAAGAPPAQDGRRGRRVQPHLRHDRHRGRGGHHHGALQGGARR